MELPEFQELYNRYRSNGLRVLTLNLDNRELGDKSTREIWKRGGFSFNSFSDSDRQISNALRIETLPSAVVLDRKGRLAFSSFGANDWRSPETTQLIEDLLLEE
jgi:peroxiredoxin